MTDLEKAVKDLQENLIVLAEIERRQPTMLKENSVLIIATEQRLVRLNTEAAEFRRRTDQNLAEITDKLNGLIGYIDGMRPPQ